MSEFEQLKEDIGDLKDNVNNLNTNVAVVKNEIQDMKHSVTSAIDKISDSMVSLASVTEKLNFNVEEHRIINNRIENLEESQKEQNILLIELRNSHILCSDRRKEEEEERKNSPWNKAKDKAFEYVFIAIVALVIFILASHFGEFSTFLNSTGNANPVLK